ncbi:MAG: Transcription initiation factor IIA small chain (TFIIA 13.5 kDa subunit) [Bogoriella megaspora]|nr:MAG: Transcription initiation factor IIA small chain (TFIIA 13.5 kDa subunit) [Bogoriella megaspora]
MSQPPHTKSNDSDSHAGAARAIGEGTHGKQPAGEELRGEEIEGWVSGRSPQEFRLGQPNSGTKSSPSPIFSPATVSSLLSSRREDELNEIAQTNDPEEKRRIHDSYTQRRHREVAIVQALSPIKAEPEPDDDDLKTVGIKKEDTDEQSFVNPFSAPYAGSAVIPATHPSTLPEFWGSGPAPTLNASFDPNAPPRGVSPFISRLNPADLPLYRPPPPVNLTNRGALIPGVRMSEKKDYYELYRRSTLGVTLLDTLDELITDRKIEPQLAMKILSNFDKCMSEVLADKVKARLNFKGHLDTYRFCDDVWTFVIKDVNFKLDNQSTVHADRVKIVSCNNKKAEGNEK